jgi:hypothetical protein
MLWSATHQTHAQELQRLITDLSKIKMSRQPYSYFMCYTNMAVINYVFHSMIHTKYNLMIIIFWEMTPCGSYKNHTASSPRR